CVLRHTIVRRYRPLLSPSSGPQAAAEYHKAAAERDRNVPEVYRKLDVGTFRVPADSTAWKTQRPAVLQAVRQWLGELPPRPKPPKARIISRELMPGYVLEKVSIENGVDGDVSALLLLPAGRKAPLPAILWLHSSTPDKTQVIIPGTNGGDMSLGE